MNSKLKSIHDDMDALRKQGLPNIITLVSSEFISDIMRESKGESHLYRFSLTEMRHELLGRPAYVNPYVKLYKVLGAPFGYVPDMSWPVEMWGWTVKAWAENPNDPFSPWRYCVIPPICESGTKVTHYATLEQALNEAHRMVVEKLTQE